MKLRNKKTGEVYNACHISFGESIDDLERTRWKTLREFNEDWEDVQEEEVWYLGEEIGNYALSKKDARKITKKILAWKRLKDKGFRFESWFGGSKIISFRIGVLIDDDTAKDLNLLFGDGE